MGLLRRNVLGVRGSFIIDNGGSL